MFINIDAKQLEWVAAVFLSKDKVGYDELRDGTDLHSDNQKRLKLPTRTVAKAFLFRLLYGGSAFAYGNDPDFAPISRNERYWQEVIDNTYFKYKGLSRWHSSLMQEVSRTGVLVVETGRRYKFSRGESGDLPRTKILNYPVQGLGHDLMAVFRVYLFTRLKLRPELKSKCILTVHDSVLLDCPEEEVAEILNLILEVLNDFSAEFERVFKVPFDLPFRAEISLGVDLSKMYPLTQQEIENGNQSFRNQ